MQRVNQARVEVSAQNATAAPSLLNLGCGQRFHADWINLDLMPVAVSVRRWDAGP